MSARLRYQAAAEYLGIPVGTLRSLVSRGQVPHFKITEGRGGLVLFDVAELDAWLASKRVPASGGGQ